MCLWRMYLCIWEVYVFICIGGGLRFMLVIFFDFFFIMLFEFWKERESVVERFNLRLNILYLYISILSI